LQEVITKHTEQASAAKEDDAIQNYPFQVIFAADAKDNVKVTVRWPQDAVPFQTVRTIATMLHHISAGHWKPPMIESVKKYGTDAQQIDVSMEILREWGQARQAILSEATCVVPRSVFRPQPPPQG